MWPWKMVCGHKTGQAGARLTARSGSAGVARRGAAKARWRGRGEPRRREPAGRALAQEEGWAPTASPSTQHSLGAQGSPPELGTPSQNTSLSLSGEAMPDCVGDRHRYRRLVFSGLVEPRVDILPAERVANHTPRLYIQPPAPAVVQIRARGVGHRDVVQPRDRGPRGSLLSAPRGSKGTLRSKGDKYNERRARDPAPVPAGVVPACARLLHGRQPTGTRGALGCYSTAGGQDVSSSVTILQDHVLRDMPSCSA